jgi:hypothetical protein
MPEAKMKKYIRTSLQRLKRWLNEEKEQEIPFVPFDNEYIWLRATFQKLMRDPMCSRKPAYSWGALQGVALGKVLGMRDVSLIEFGVAAGRGLLTLEYIADRIQEMIDVKIAIYGFDTVSGLTKPQDYRDCPNIFLENQFPMDKEQLERCLRRATLKLGPVKDTVPAFLQSTPAPVAFVSFDLDLYSSTRDALILFEGKHNYLLPRVFCYFDDINGLTYSDYNGERLAISEFNDRHTTRKLSPAYGLQYFVPEEYKNVEWPTLFYFAHIFDHPLYNEPDQIRKPVALDLEGQVTQYKVK